MHHQEGRPISWLFATFTKGKAIFLILCLGYVVYFNAFFNGFVWDDGLQIVQNPALSQPNIFYYFSHLIGPYYRPLMQLSFAIIYKLFGLQSFFFHFFQISIHIVNTILLFIILSKFFKRLFLPFFLSLVFLVHPINVESVVYISTLQESYYMLFGLLSLFLIQHYYFKEKKYVVIFLLSLLGLFSKETFVLFLCIQIIYAFLFQRKYIFWQTSASLLSFATYVAIRIILVGTFNPTHFDITIPNTPTTASLFERLINIPNVFLYYLYTFLFPKDLAVAQYWWFSKIDIQHFLFPLILLLLVFCTIGLLGYYLYIHKSKQFQPYLFFCGWFVIGLLFHSQIIPLDFTVADRWFYFPIIGLLGLIGIGLDQIISKGKNLHTALVVATIFIIFVLSIRTMLRNANWYDGLTLFSHDEKVLSNNPEIEYNLGLALGLNKNYAQAETHLTNAMHLLPKDLKIVYTLCLVYQESGQPQKAIPCFTTIEQSGKTNFAYLSYINESKIFFAENKPENVKELLENDALKVWPFDATLWLYDGFANYQMNDHISALAAFEKAYNLVPNETTNYYYFNVKDNQPIEIRF